uniref:Uncharacterized protein n=1 Tax=Triticum urartu TaxID=4572 RepID=A0A8R7US29_TRIUA
MLPSPSYSTQLLCGATDESRSTSPPLLPTALPRGASWKISNLHTRRKKTRRTAGGSQGPWMSSRGHHRIQMRIGSTGKSSIPLAPIAPPAPAPMPNRILSVAAEPLRIKFGNSENQGEGI